MMVLKMIMGTNGKAGKAFENVPSRRPDGSGD